MQRFYLRFADIRGKGNGRLALVNALRREKLFGTGWRRAEICDAIDLFNADLGGADLFGVGPDPSDLSMPT